VIKGEKAPEHDRAVSRRDSIGRFVVEKACTAKWLDRMSVGGMYDTAWWVATCDDARLLLA
jgi:hypothetical protein